MDRKKIKKIAKALNAYHVGRVSQVPSIASRPRKKKSKTLNALWSSQVKFMRLLQEHRGFPLFPVEMSSKDGQRHVREIVHDCVHELFEALAELKNYKKHRVTNVNEFNRDNFIEEFVDSLKFLLEALILSGITIEEFIHAFDKKTKVNEERIKGNY